MIYSAQAILGSQNNLFLNLNPVKGYERSESILFMYLIS